MFSYGGLLQIVIRRFHNLVKKDQKGYLFGFFTMGSGWSGREIPPGTGPHAVGCTDFMMDHTVQGCFFRLYYPCQKTGKAENALWVPEKEYFTGLSDFMKIARSFGQRMFNYLYGSYKIPAFTDAPFKCNEKCPVIIFSHGLGAFRTLYSAVCVELASQGFIVASVEHRDESASATYYFLENNGSDRVTESLTGRSNTANLVKDWMYYRALRTGETEYPLRNKQVKLRAKECVVALEKLEEINSGTDVQNVFQTQFDWSTLKDTMDMCKVAAVGHSFGGATVVEALAKEVKFKCGVALDSWMFPLDDEVFPRVKQPLFFINSETFQWAGNIIKMKKLDSTFVQRKMITIRGTVHQSFPDFTFLTNPWLGKLMKLKGSIDPKVGIDLSNKATLAFLERHLGLEKHFNQWDPLIDGLDESLIKGTNVTLP